MKTIRSILKILLLIIPVGLLILLATQKSNLNNYLSQQIKSQIEPEIIKTIGYSIDSLYNYVDNGNLFEYTFLEFGAKGCSACARMEIVMEDIRAEYPNQINVVFYNILFPENVEMMKYYGVSSIPTQILLDRSGKEFFRHSGYYSKSELLSKFTNNKY